MSSTKTLREALWTAAAPATAFALLATYDLTMDTPRFSRYGFIELAGVKKR